MYIEYMKKCTNIENCVHLMYEIVYIPWKIVFVEFTELCSFSEKLCTKCSELRTFFEKLCILNIQYCIRWMYKIERFCPLNMQNCVNSLKNWVHWIYRIVYIDCTEFKNV